MKSLGRGPVLRISKLRPRHVRRSDATQYTEHETNQFKTRLAISRVRGGGRWWERRLTCDVVGAEVTESNADEWSMVCSLSSTTSSSFSPSLSIVQRMTRGSFRRSVCKPLSDFGDASKCMNQ